MRPPNQPAMAPIGTPMKMMTTWTTKATVMLIRAPSSNRLSRSRPSWSVPRRWLGENGGSGSVAVGEDRLEVLDLVRPRREERAEDPAEQQQR